jgi:hypothetical protein
VLPQQQRPFLRRRLLLRPLLRFALLELGEELNVQPGLPLPPQQAVVVMQVRPLANDSHLSRLAKTIREF